MSERIAVAATVTLLLVCGLAGTADAKVPAPWRNCAAVNARYPHGVGKVGAHDNTTGVPVTNFTRSNKLYALALSYNKGLDRDHDSIACEKH